MSGLLSFPLLENELFSSHWDDDWDIVDQAKDNEKSSQDDERNSSQRVSEIDGQNGNQDDKDHGNNVDVEEVREDISKVIENVMQAGIDEDAAATSNSGSGRSSSSAELRRRQLLPSKKLKSSRRGMSALDLVASSPPTSFEIYHKHQPIRGRKSHPTRPPTRE
jgi:hypothetical protein